MRSKDFGAVDTHVFWHIYTVTIILQIIRGTEIKTKNKQVTNRTLG